MAQQTNGSPQPPWQYSQTLGGFFVYRRSTDWIILQNGRNFARPTYTPAAELEYASYDGPLPPPRNNANNDNGQRERQDVQAPRGRGRGRGQGQGWGRGRGRGRGRGQGSQSRNGPGPIQNDHHQAGRQQPFQPQPWTDAQGPSYGTQTPQAGHDLISGIDGLTLASQASSSQAWPQQENNAGLSRGFDPETQVHSLIQRAAPEIVTPPEVLAEGIVARSRLLGTQSGDSEALDSSFTIHPKRFFAVGRVFKILWTETAGANTTAITRNTFQNVRGEMVHAKVRWFVIIREGFRDCCALPIATYGGQGVAKPGVVKSEHAIIYTGSNVPSPSMEELVVQPNEELMRPEPIKVDPDSRIERLDPMSRINFAAISTVQHNVKVKNMGMVNRNSIATLHQHFRNVWFASGGPLHQSQQGPATNPTVYGHAGNSLGPGGFNAVSAQTRRPATIAGARHGTGEVEDGDNEVDDEDAEGGASSDSSDGSGDGEENEDDES